MAAQHRRKGAEAAAVFRSIPELLPGTKELPGGLNNVQRDDFHLGWCARVKALEAAAE
ncbi:hypothetical protein [Streptomyces sp. 130]|uniref:hypothetical protein n=1 Tax=Streptomyces sp. 130 TaxID=2591006 RepID=UPI0021B13BA8|nr:hypothetical protein [Streptomyces sp. 130]